MAPRLKDPWNQHSAPCKSKTMVQKYFLSGVAPVHTDSLRLTEGIVIFTLVFWTCICCLYLPHWKSAVCFTLRFLSQSVICILPSLFWHTCSEAWNHREAATADTFRWAAGSRVGASCWEGSWTLSRMGGGTQSRGTWWKDCFGMFYLFIYDEPPKITLFNHSLYLPTRVCCEWA